MELRDKIVEWHGGRKTAAISDFANALHVQRPRVQHWLSGRTWPEEDLQPAVCKLLKITPAQLAAMRPRTPAPRADLEQRLAELEKRIAALEEERGVYINPSRPKGGLRAG